MSEQDATNVIEGEAVDQDFEAEQAVVPAGNSTALAVTPQVDPAELVKRLDAIREAQETAMVKGVDYGVIPGTGEKPTLLKPGAEKLSVLFQLDVQLRNEKRWEADNHLTVVSHASVFHAPTGARLGYGEGVCSTREKGYAYRKAERVCPVCEEAAVIKGKAEYGGGWLCWAKKGGCGTKWEDGDQAIEGQESGEVDNPDLPDLWNTVVKMAEKRARVDAVLAVTGASAIFTQDVEDQLPPDEPQATGNGQQKSAPQTKAQGKKGSSKPISGQQKGKIHALLGEAGMTEVQAKAIREYATYRAGVAHFDRLSAQQASSLIEALGEDGSGAEELLNKLYVRADEGDEKCQGLVSDIESELAQAEADDGGEI